jgi:predicted Zn finger-like uncharacterized protein
MIVPCECGAKLKIDEAKVEGREVRVRCPRCGNVLTVPKLAAVPELQTSPVPAVLSAPLVLIAHDSDMVRDMVGGVLIDAGFRVEHAADGVEALAKATAQVPDAAIVDVGLPGIYGFELCERLKADRATGGIKIILLASVYGVTRYKRTPTSLYGADDYVEKHHIADSLVGKINRLLQANGKDASPAHAAPSPGSTAAAPRFSAKEFDTAFFRPETLALTDQEVHEPSGAFRKAGRPDTSRIAAAPVPNPVLQTSPEGQTIAPDSFSLESSIFEKEECDIPRVEETDPEAVEKAKRFARIIVSDIALYNQEAVVEGVRNGTFYELLKDDVEEGRRLYETRVPDAIRAGRDYYQETIQNFIAAQKKIVR